MAAQCCSQSNNYLTEKLFDSIINDDEVFHIQALLKEGVDIEARNSEGYSPLLFAGLLRRERICDMLIKSGANVFRCDEERNTILHFASEYGWTRIVRSLVKKMPDLDARDIRGDTAMHLASRSGRLDVVECLADEAVDMDLKNVVDFTPLLCAAEWSRKNVVDLLLNNGANFDGKERLLLYYASINNWTELVQFLLKKLPDLNKWYEMSETALDGYEARGHLEVVKFLVGEANDASTMNKMIARAALFKASSSYYRHNHIEVVKWLVKRVPDLNERDYQRQTALHHASNNGNFEIIKCLLEEGADVNTRDEFGWTALHNVSSLGLLEIVKYLVEKGAHINVKNFHGETPLLIAAQYNHKDVVDFFIYLGANVNGSIQRYRYTMLHVASIRGWVDIVQFLIRRGCDLDAKALLGFTALRCACKSKNFDTIQSLLKAGASWDITGMDGFSPLNCFTKKEEPDFKLIKLFIENGAYLKTVDYNAILNSSSLKVLQDKKLCFQTIINEFNNHSLPKLYRVSASESLPRIEEFKIASGSEVAQAIERTVGFEIQTKGYCNILKTRPKVLSMICVGSVLECCKKKKSEL